MRISPITINTPRLPQKRSQVAFGTNPIADSFQSETPDKFIPSNTRSKMDEVLALLKITPRSTFSENLDAIREYAITDPLSTNKNKRALFADLETYKKELPNKNQNLSVAMFDMDNFKAVNDLLGYKTGDDFIKIIGSQIQKTAEEAGFESYRFGGEEFFILFPDTNEENAAKVADKARRALNNNRTMSQYVPTLRRNAMEQIMELQEKQAPYEELKCHANKISHLEELITKKKLAKVDNLEAKATFLKEEMANHTQALSSGLNLLVKQLLDDSTVSAHEKQVLLNLGEINEENATEQFANHRLRELLEFKYDNGAKIAQIEKWANSLANTGSFTITCGVKEFDPKALNELPSEDIVDQTGDILKEGKRTVKGETYRASKLNHI